MNPLTMPTPARPTPNRSLAHWLASALAMLAFNTGTAHAADDVAAQVAAVERGLRPPVSFEGDVPWTLADRMRHYGVPGLTISVVHDGKAAWTRVYGLADREAGLPMTERTLLLAGSVSKPAG